MSECSNCLSDLMANSWIKVPEGVRRLFDKFPIVTLPSATYSTSYFEGSERVERVERDSEVGNSESSGKRIELFVYNGYSDHAKGRLVACDPEGLEVQALFRLYNVDNVMVHAVSWNASSDGTLPMVIERPLKKAGSGLELSAGKNKLYKSKVIVQNIAEIHRSDNVYRSLITSSLRDCWILTMLENPEIRRDVYCKDTGIRIAWIESSISLTFAVKLLRELTPRYPELVAAATTNSKWIFAEIFGQRKQVQDEVQDIYSNAKQCLNIFNSLLEQSRDGTLKYLSNNDSTVGEENELNGKQNLSSLDILLYSYTKPILKWASATKLGDLLQSHSKLIQHSKLVESILF